MAAQLSDRTIIGREQLLTVAEARLRDATALFEAGRFSAAVYLSGYAVECYLKAVICRTLDLDELPATFAVHDLELLLLHSGLTRRIQKDALVFGAFRELCRVWNEAVRYDIPERYIELDARRVFDWVTKVVQWLKQTIS